MVFLNLQRARRRLDGAQSSSSAAHSTTGAVDFSPPPRLQPQPFFFGGETTRASLAGGASASTTATASPGCVAAAPWATAVSAAGAIAASGWVGEASGRTKLASKETGGVLGSSVPASNEGDSESLTTRVSGGGVSTGGAAASLIPGRASRLVTVAQTLLLVTCGMAWSLRPYRVMETQYSRSGSSVGFHRAYTGEGNPPSGTSTSALPMAFWTWAPSKCDKPANTNFWVELPVLVCNDSTVTISLAGVLGTLPS